MYKGKRLLHNELIHIFKNSDNGYLGIGILDYAGRSF